MNQISINAFKLRTNVWRQIDIKMSAFLRCIATLLTIYGCQVIFASNEILEEAMRQANIIPRVLTAAPNETLELLYTNQIVKIQPGRLYEREDIRGIPKLNWTVQRFPVYYTIVAIGLNEWELFDRESNTSTDIPPEPHLIHWLIMNCPNTNYKKGTLMYPYRTPMPPRGYNKMYHLFLIYKQTIGYDLVDIRHMVVPPLRFYERRKKYDFQNLSEFTNHFQLEHLIAANFFIYQFRPQHLEYP